MSRRILPPVPFRHLADIRDPQTGRICAPFRLNWTSRECRRCHEVKPGNGHWCDDCWFAVVIYDEPEELVRPARLGRPEAVNPCQATLF